MIFKICLLSDFWKFTKYYSRILQRHRDTDTVRSGHIYQIFSYVKNMQANHCLPGVKRVSGMVLYAATDEALLPDQVYRISGSSISVRTLDLNRPFSDIAASLRAIVDEHFGS